jgi:hypothetical protein
MSTQSQIRANRENAQRSTGPTTEAGKAASSRNNFHHGLAGGNFAFLEFEHPTEYDQLLAGLHSEHEPSTTTEAMLVEQMAQSYWLRKRALFLQHRSATDDSLTLVEQQKQLALFLRYQSTHDRAFHRALNDLLKLRAEKRKQEIGFESQRRQDAIVALRQSAEKRKQELHQFNVLLAEAKVDYQTLLNSTSESDRKAAAANQTHSPEATQAA